MNPRNHSCHVPYSLFDTSMSLFVQSFSDLTHCFCGLPTFRFPLHSPSYINLSFLLFSILLICPNLQRILSSAISSLLFYVTLLFKQCIRYSIYSPYFQQTHKAIHMHDIIIILDLFYSLHVIVPLPCSKTDSTSPSCSTLAKLGQIPWIQMQFNSTYNKLGKIIKLPPIHTDFTQTSSSPNTITLLLSVFIFRTFLCILQQNTL